MAAVGKKTGTWRGWVRAALIMSSASWAVGCDSEEIVGIGYDSKVYTQRIQLWNISREYNVYVPRDLDPSRPAPLVFAFHGAPQSPEGMELMTWLYPEADAYGAVIVFPKAIDLRWSLPVAHGEVDDNADVAFVEAILERVSQDISIDRDRVYATGYSRGALFAHVLACEKPEILAGIAPVAATVGRPTSEFCRVRQALPVVWVQGDQDDQFPWNDGLAYWRGQLGGDESIEYFVAMNQCTGEYEVTPIDLVDDGTSVEQWDFQGCAPGVDLRFYKVLDGGHTWPGSPVDMSGLGKKTRDIVASRVVMDFLMAHERQGGA